MPLSYLQTAATPRRTSQSEPIPGSGQVENSAGGYAWEITSLQRLRRFLILGSEGGTYYAREQELVKQNVEGVRLALDEYGTVAVDEIVAISKGGKAPKNDPALYALAIACSHSDQQVRRAALDAIPDVARIGTHLFHFAEFLEEQRGWGRGARQGIAAWYERADLRALTYQLVKYRQRDGWTHRDMLRLAHPNTVSEEHAAIFDWICGRGLGDGLQPQEDSATDPRVPLEAFEAAKIAETPEVTAGLIKLYGGALPREALNPEHLNTSEVWGALLDAGMPMTALIRNLPTLTRHGVIGQLKTATTSKVAKQLTDEQSLQKARVHPLSLLVAMATYKSGESLRGSATWAPESAIVDALDAAFYASFDHVEPTGQRTLLAMDISGSMGSPMSGTPLSCREGAAALAMVGARTEPNHAVVGFSHELIPLAISPRQRLDDIVNSVRGLPFGRTDCALPMLYALEKGLEVDVFQIVTDNETWHGDIHPAQALKQYRERTGIDAKLVVIAMTATPFSIADPNDNGMLDVVGFDTSTPQIISDFVSG